ncbi:MAG TPA: formylmethanofuran dehydrogenase [Burkholderiaceae bacterium]|nr:formylmethanofuran dehydrogenase [Burkholderiaceae bacterium]
MTAAASTVAWTCPFCALLCDEYGLDDAAGRPALRGSTCPRAQAALDAHGAAPGAVPGASPRVNGSDATWDEALQAAAERLGHWRQPLFAGLGTDVAGARAAYRLVERTGGICDPAGGAALVHGLRALQDRGQYTATLAEVRARADLVVCIGTTLVERYPEVFRRLGLDTTPSPCQALVFLDIEPPPGLPVRVPVQQAVGTGDLADDLQQLAGLVNGQHVRAPAPALQALANQLLGARYAVIVWEPGVLPPHGALIAEAIQRIVATLNRRTRAATLALGGNDGAASVNQVFTWLSGLPVRTRHGAAGLEHDPLRFDAQRLLADRAVDGLVWISSFDPRSLPPAEAAGLPRIILAPPAALAALASGVAAPAEGDVFLPVATPGLNSAGHLFRTDGIVVVPLEAVRDDGLRSVAQVLSAIDARLGSPSSAASGGPPEGSVRMLPATGTASSSHSVGARP